VPCAALALVLWLSASPALAHQDRRFQVSPKGEITGLPPEYGTISVAIARGRKAPAVTVRIGSHVTELPRCVARFFKGASARDLRAGGSWWHDLERLPAYLTIAVIKSEDEEGIYEGHSLIFELDSGRLRDVWGVTDESGRRRTLDALCTASERERLTPRDESNVEQRPLSPAWAERSSAVVQATYVAAGHSDNEQAHAFRVDRVLKGQLPVSNLLLDGFDETPRAEMPPKLERNRRYVLYLANPKALPRVSLQDAVAIVDLDQTPTEALHRREKIKRWGELERFELTTSQWKTLRSKRSLDFELAAAVLHALRKLVFKWSKPDQAHALLGPPDRRIPSQHGVSEVYYLSPSQRKDPGYGAVLAKVTIFYSTKDATLPVSYEETFMELRDGKWQQTIDRLLKARDIKPVRMQRPTTRSAI
jgi:hypothetical protein